MEYLIDIRFDNKNCGWHIHFVITIHVSDEREESEFVNEIESGIVRRGGLNVIVKSHRIDNDSNIRMSSYEYIDCLKARANGVMRIEQFHVARPDQRKSLYGNLFDKFFNGESSLANIGSMYLIPIKVTDSRTHNLVDEFCYYTIEQLIPL